MPWSVRGPHRGMQPWFGCLLTVRHFTGCSALPQAVDLALCALCLRNATICLHMQLLPARPSPVACCMNSGSEVCDRGLLALHNPRACLLQLFLCTARAVRQVRGTRVSSQLQLISKAVSIRSHRKRSLLIAPFQGLDDNDERSQTQSLLIMKPRAHKLCLICHVTWPPFCMHQAQHIHACMSTCFCRYATSYCAPHSTSSQKLAACTLSIWQGTCCARARNRKHAEPKHVHGAPNLALKALPSGCAYAYSWRGMRTTGETHWMRPTSWDQWKEVGWQSKCTQKPT